MQQKRKPSYPNCMRNEVWPQTFIVYSQWSCRPGWINISWLSFTWFHLESCTPFNFTNHLNLFKIAIVLIWLTMNILEQAQTCEMCVTTFGWFDGANLETSCYIDKSHWSCKWLFNVALSFLTYLARSDLIWHKHACHWPDSKLSVHRCIACCTVAFAHCKATRNL